MVNSFDCGPILDVNLHSSYNYNVISSAGVSEKHQDIAVR